MRIVPMRPTPAFLLSHLTGALLVAVVVLSGCSEEQIAAAAAQVPDFRGNYAITHEDNVTITVTVGGAETTYTGLKGSVIQVGEAELDLAEVCAFEGVDCPSEAFWQEVAVDQPLFDELMTPYNPWLINVTNLDETAHTMEKGGLVDKTGQLVLFLGLGVEATGPCGLVAGSGASAKFEMGEDELPTGNIAGGAVSVVFAGGCLLPNEDAFVGATIKLRSTFTGVRTGDLAIPTDLTPGAILDEDGKAVVIQEPEE